MIRRRRPHPFIPTVLGAMVAVPVYGAAVEMGAQDRTAAGVAVLAAGVLGLLLGSVRKSEE